MKRYKTSIFYDNTYITPVPKVKMRIAEDGAWVRFSDVEKQLTPIAELEGLLREIINEAAGKGSFETTDFQTFSTARW